MSERKFNEGDWVRVNKKAKKDSYFWGKKGKVVGFTNRCYDIEFFIPGNKRKELRRINPTKLTRTTYR